MASKHHTLKILIAVIAIVIVIFVALFWYILAELAKIPPTVVQSKLLTPYTSAHVVSKSLLTYNYSKIIPYILLSYNAENVTRLSFEGEIFAFPPPYSLYILNVTNECYECGNETQFVRYLINDTLAYGQISSSNISNVSFSDLMSIKNFSVLVVPSGLLPEQLLGPINSTSGVTLLDYLLEKGIYIIYIGKNFSNILLPGSVVAPSSNLPYYLNTTPLAYKKKSEYYFNATTFNFSKGVEHGPLTYFTTYSGGAIVAFSNFLSSWKSPQEAAADVSKVISEDFWIPKASSASKTINVTSGSVSGVLGLPFFNATMMDTLSDYKFLNYSTGRIVIVANFSNSKGTRLVYRTLFFTPPSSLNGTIGVPLNITPGYSTPFLMEIFTNSTVPMTIVPHLDIYTINMSKVYSVPFPAIKAFGNFSFIKYLSLYIPPGSYIAELLGYSNNLYASAFFSISPIKIGLAGANFQNNSYSLYVESGGKPLYGINYSVSLNGLYPSNGVISGGIINYTLPKGAPEEYGNLNFKISMLGSNFTFLFLHPAPKIIVNKKYIEIGIVLAITLILIVGVKEPNRDEFYIDVPSLPSREKVNVQIPANEMLSMFDKLNVKYHWKFMPLSISEIKSAISENIRYNNMPIGVTYSNVEAIVNELMARGSIVGMDGLYAPKEWIEKSGHDIEYLATFKKIRLYLMTHGYIFTDIDSSNLADIVATVHGERTYIVIYSKTSRFLKVPVYKDQITYIAFINSFRLEEFKSTLYSSYTPEAERLKIYISSESVRLMDSDAPEEVLS
ncbi:MAG: hypothetical protein ACP5SA_00525 [Candidatus Micrarchaeia archaeon]